MKMLLQVVRPAACAAFVALVTLAGCDTGPGPRAQVKGKVTFNNQPVTAGTVSFFGAKNRVGSAPLMEDGTYEVVDAPVGDVTITITIPELSPGGIGGIPAPSKPVPGLPTATDQDPTKKRPGTVVVDIPKQYKKLETSTLKYTVTKGSNDKDIDLTP